MSNAKPTGLESAAYGHLNERMSAAGSGKAQMAAAWRRDAARARRGAEDAAANGEHETAEILFAAEAEFERMARELRDR
jgi:hypothetical protein